MAQETPCQTPGARFHSHISGQKIEVSVNLPQTLDLSEAEAKLLDTNLHNALELVLARYFTREK